MNKSGCNLQSSYGEDVGECWCVLDTQVATFLRHDKACNTPLFQLIDKMCSDLALFPRSVEFQSSLSIQIQSKEKRSEDKCCCECRKKLTPKKAIRQVLLHGWETKKYI